MRDLSIFQWGRLGDLIQTGIVIERWRRLGGNCRLCFDARFNDLIQSLDGRFAPSPVDLQRIVTEVRTSKSMAAGLASLQRCGFDESTLRIKRHLVLSRSKPAALFSALREPAIQWGFSWRAGVLEEPRLLKEYLRGNSAFRPLPVHICDIWSLLAGMQSDSPVSYHEAWGIDANDAEERSGILIFADAGEETRTPPLAWLAKLARILQQASGQPMTIVGARKGTKHDEIQSLCATIKSDFEDLRGETDLVSLTELCRESKFALGADTGGLHLAAACGCQVIGFYCGGASALNTGPYVRSAAIAHDLSWTEEEIQDVTQEIEACLMQQRPHAGSPKSINWSRPAWDSLGILYLPDTIMRSQLSKLIAARIELVRRWSPQQSSSTNHATETATDQLMSQVVS